MQCIEFLHVYADNIGTALMLLAYMLPDVRSSPNSEKILYFTKVSYINLKCIIIFQ